MNERDLNAYQTAYGDLPFEATQVHYRRKKILEVLKAHGVKRLLEVGCGLEPLFLFLEDLEAVYIVEPAGEFAQNAARLARDRVGVQVIQSTMEDAVPQLKGKALDAAVVASLLHELPDPTALLKAVHEVCGPETIVHVNVPNARSFHRLLAVEMGLIPDPKTLSATQQKLQQSHTFDLQSLTQLMESAGFQAEESGSMFVKPFTHGQMASLAAAGILTPAMLDGLEKMVKYMPDLGSELYVNARIKTGD